MVEAILDRTLPPLRRHLVILGARPLLIRNFFNGHQEPADSHDDGDAV